MWDHVIHAPSNIWLHASVGKIKMLLVVSCRVIVVKLFVINSLIVEIINVRRNVIPGIVNLV